MVKVQFGVRDLELPERSKGFTSSRQEGGLDSDMFHCGITTERNTHIVRQCEVYHEERHVFKNEMRKLDERDTQQFGILRSTRE